MCANMMTMDAALKLAQLRSRLIDENLDYYFIPSSDPHQNEYVPLHWQRRQWISGFTGSAGDVLVGREQAYLWTDGRYTLQAAQQLDSDCFTLMVQGDSTPIDQWLAALGRPVVVGVDPQVISIDFANRLDSVLLKHGGQLKPIANNLVDAIRDDLADSAQAPVRLQAVAYAGDTVVAKLARVRQALKVAGVDTLATNVLDNIAWLLNVRGGDIQFNPLVVSFLIVSANTVWWFVDENKIDHSIRASIEEDGVVIKPYTLFGEKLASLGGRVLMSPTQASSWMKEVAGKATLVLKPSPIDAMKAIKNEAEIAGMRKAHHLDGLALCRFAYWLTVANKLRVTEQDCIDQLAASRFESSDCLDLSFDTICGYGANGAVIHYHCSPSTNKAIGDNSLMLLDSGGQYRGGTTDVTRIFCLGKPTRAQRQHYTLVLKAHLQLRHTPFPIGTTGNALDAITRAPLWAAGLNYAHGTGHGVGAHLCVHEGPIGISPGVMGRLPIEKNMVVSNEPGAYFEGEYGIRIENLCVVADSDQPGFLTLDDLTLMPYNRLLIDTSLLSQQEIQWVDDYHARVNDALRYGLEKPVAAWLREATLPL